MRRVIVFCLLCVAPAFSVDKLTPKEELYFLKSAIDRTIYQVDPNLNIGIEVVSLKNGLKLYEKNAEHMFVPASVQKLFTAAAALSILGSNFQFETALFSLQEIKEGAINGDLYLKGSGDPSLVTEDLEDLARQLAMAGVTEIRGDLLIDNFDFDAITLGPGWMWDEGAEYWNSPIDALLVNHSCITVWVEAARKGGLPPRVVVSPEIPGVVIRNLGKTDVKRKDFAVTRKWVTRENIIEISGTIELGAAPEEYRIPLESPALYTAMLFRQLLEKQNIHITGGVRMQRVPDAPIRLAWHTSLPLSQLIFPVLKKSDNLYANCLFKKIGQQMYEAPGTWQKGAQAVCEFLTNEVGMDTSTLTVVDGDGESRYNLVSPHQMVTFLTWMKDKFLFFPEFLTALPISGIDLKHRMQEIAGRVRAKPGTMTGISSLAGYVTTKEDETLVFAIMMGGFVKPAKVYKKDLEDPVCELLVNFSQ